MKRTNLVKAGMSKRIKVILVVGARPNYMKAAPIFFELKKYKQFKPIIVHTGQHYDKEMSDLFFRDLKLPKPDVYLGVGSASHAVQTARIMEKFEPVCLKEKPDLVMVVGDVNSTIACALTAVKLGIKVAHVEAGLRSFDRTMPEEINRLLTDQISDYLFTTCEDADTNLIREGIDRKKISFVGNAMIDTLMRLRAKSKAPGMLRKYGFIPRKQSYGLATLHRPSNVDKKKTLQGILSAISEVSNYLPVILPLHPRTEKQLDDMHFLCYDPEFHKGILFTPPLGYLEFMGLMKNAALVLTDSGGIQEETTILGVPCLTIRENTERPITITQGTNKLVGTNPERIVTEAKKIIKYHCNQCNQSSNHWHRRSKRMRRPQYWDGKAAMRIVRALKRQMQ